MKWLLLVFYIMAIQYNRWLARLANEKAHYATGGLMHPNLPRPFRYRSPTSLKVQAYAAPVLMLVVIYFYDAEAALVLAIVYPGVRYFLSVLGVLWERIFRKQPT